MKTNKLNILVSALSGLMCVAYLLSYFFVFTPSYDGLLPLLILFTLHFLFSFAIVSYLSFANRYNMSVKNNIASILFIITLLGFYFYAFFLVLPDLGKADSNILLLFTSPSLAFYSLVGVMFMYILAIKNNNSVPNKGSN